MDDEDCQALPAPSVELWGFSAGVEGSGPLGGVSRFGKDPCLDHLFAFAFVLVLERSTLLPFSPEARVETELRDGARALASGVLGAE
jgi:hypothetical protein